MSEQPLETDGEDGVEKRPSITQGEGCWARGVVWTQRGVGGEIWEMDYPVHQFLPALAIQQKHPITGRPQRLLLSQCQWCLGVVTSWLA